MKKWWKCTFFLLSFLYGEWILKPWILRENNKYRIKLFTLQLRWFKVKHTHTDSVAVLVTAGLIHLDQNTCLSSAAFCSRETSFLVLIDHFSSGGTAAQHDAEGLVSGEHPRLKPISLDFDISPLQPPNQGMTSHAAAWRLLCHRRAAAVRMTWTADL